VAPTSHRLRPSRLGRALYGLNGLPEEIRNGPRLLTLLVDDKAETARIIDILWGG
jgi:hypothetical protein